MASNPFGGSVYDSIADIALASTSRDLFRNQLFSYLDHIIGFDLAAVAHSMDGVQCEVSTRGSLDASVARERM